ncbi:GyrI-like domain-containing protein [uncultured Kocuria sp.]|uniref:GyrI-like domain-containing protein n=1 Tax=uncultured Kocuria sp. TaxID=259305 RepID=UPI00263315F4|nr:GyrI-like domain-containing protein [uncultured Kocuria sp.]
MDARQQDAESPRVIEHQEQPMAVVTGTVAMSELREFFDRSFGELGKAMADGAFEPSGPPMAVYHGVPAETVHLEVGFPVRGQVTPQGSVVAHRLPASRAATSVHRGNYDDLGRSWQRLAEWAGSQGLALGDRMWEVYVTEPRPGDDPADMVTELHWALRQ